MLISLQMIFITADGPSFRAEIAFLYDPFMGFASTLDSIFELAISLGQLLYDLISPARGITIEDGGLQKYASTELELMRGLVRRGWRLERSTHAITFRPT